MDAFRAERLRGERGRERRVDAAGDADDDVAEAVLLHVVAKAELEREPHLVELGERRCQRAGGRLGQVDQSSASSNPGALATTLPSPIEHERVPVEDELVLAADGVAEDQRTAVVPRTGREHLLALRVLADVKGRRGEVDEQPGARRGALDSGRARLPQVLAHRQADRASAVLEQADVRSRLEVPLLVEDAVVRQQPLAIDGRDLAVLADEARVVERPFSACGAPTSAVMPVAASRDLAGRARGRADERGAEQEVFRRIAGDRELGEDDEPGAGVAGLGDPRDDAVAVAVEVADGRVDLGERQPHRFSPISL